MSRKYDVGKLAEEDAARMIEGYKKGGHTCKVCSRTFIPLFGSEEFREKVKALVVHEVGHDVQEGWVNDSGYCEGCRWSKFGTGLKVRVDIKIPRRSGEMQQQTVDRLMRRLTRLKMTFSIVEHWPIWE